MSSGVLTTTFTRSGSGRSGSGSEIFDRLPDSGLNGNEIDLSPSDSEEYSQLDSLDREVSVYIDTYKQCSSVYSTDKGLS